ncbi:MAG: DUF1592 domain-containing protein [Planctomycetaceae bacterium]
MTLLRPHRPARSAALLARVGVPLLVVAMAGRPAPGEDDALAGVTPLLRVACGGCHDAATAAGGFSMPTEWDPAEPRVLDRLVRMHDRVRSDEMPPVPGELAPADRRALVAALAAAAGRADLAAIRAGGRVPLRRLNRHEFEQALRTLLELPDLDVADLLPEDRLRDGFPKSAEGLDLSRLQVEGTLDAIDAALAEAVASGVEPPEPARYAAASTRLFGGTAYGEPEARYFAREGLPVESPAADDPEVECAIFRSAYWPYHGYPAGFVAGRPGRYAVRFRARAVLQQPDRSLRPAERPVPMTFRARAPSGPDVSGDVRAVGGIIDVGPVEADHETTVLLRAGQTIEWSPLGLAVPPARNVDGGPPTYRFPPPPPGGHPGIAVRSLEIVGPLPVEDGVWPPTSHRLLFGDLPLRAGDGTLPVEVVPADPPADARRLLRAFAARLHGGDAVDDDVAAAEDVVLDALRDGSGFTAALLCGYRVLLASPRLLFLADPRGGVTPGDARSLAARLSFFLWNDLPDAALLEAARRGALCDPAGVAAVADRLVDDPRFERFVGTFTDHWLDLRHLRRDEPDARLYPEYRFDDWLVESLGRETRAFVQQVIRGDAPVAAFIDGDSLLVNDRLAAHYGLPPVSGSALREVPRPPGSPRGGLLGQGSILKVTANGTSTSPVRRGAWVMARLLGEPPPPPPEKVPAVEPDIRGATGIRDLLARHTADASCAACHRRFDAVGFALEAFDVCGGQRVRYRGLVEPNAPPGDGLVTGIDRAGHDFAWRFGAPIDASGSLADGTAFDDLRGLKRALAGRDRQMARHLLGLFTAYATGAPVRFSDRPHVEAILDAAEPGGFRVRGLLRRFVASPLFSGAMPGTEGAP